MTLRNDAYGETRVGMWDHFQLDRRERRHGSLSTRILHSGDTVLITSAPSRTTSISSEQRQAWVDASTKTMQRAGYYVNEAIKMNAIDDALRHAAVLLGELRADLLPSSYFSLWTQACGELGALSCFFSSPDKFHYDHVSLVRCWYAAARRCLFCRVSLLWSLSYSTTKSSLLETFSRGSIFCSRLETQR